ncbi:prosaposin-like isoform X2 [Elgaria multicarinata webbii]|uniref:prosaposin-like isoform X2 n=1 Tax=Elgaria multicarinata webbii TaxID=159646 RepID=UPI002FCCD7AA
MAWLLILYLKIAAGTVLAESDLGPPETCLQGPEFWCRDVATAAECNKEEYCWIHEWNSLVFEAFVEEVERPGPKQKCLKCIKIMQTLKDQAGDETDEDKIDDAIKATCKAVDKRLRKDCKKLMKKFHDQIVDALQNGKTAQEICVDIKRCKSDLSTPPALARSDLGPPEACWQGPEFWCKDVATAAACNQEEYCWTDEWSSSLDGVMEEVETLAPQFKCTICKKIVQKIRDLAGDDPDDDKIDQAISTTCKVVGRFLRGPCKNFLRKYKKQLVEDLQDNMETQQICVNLKICKGDLKATPALARSDLGPPEACWQGPEFWCKDVATAAACNQEEYCWTNEWSTSEEKLMEEVGALAPLFKCTICKKIVQKIRDLAGDDPDDEKIDQAISTMCKVVGRLLRGPCKNFLRMYKKQLVEDLQNNMETQQICVNLKICKGDLKATPGLAYYYTATE